MMGKQVECSNPISKKGAICRDTLPYHTFDSSMLYDAGLGRRVGYPWSIERRSPPQMEPFMNAPWLTDERTRAFISGLPYSQVLV